MDQHGHLWIWDFEYSIDTSFLTSSSFPAIKCKDTCQALLNIPPETRQSNLYDCRSEYWRLGGLLAHIVGSGCLKEVNDPQYGKPELISSENTCSSFSSLLRGLLHNNCNLRLGATPNSTKRLKQHRFFFDFPCESAQKASYIPDDFEFISMPIPPFVGKSEDIGTLQKPRNFRKFEV
jgi:hypothetical protein